MNYKIFSFLIIIALPQLFSFTVVNSNLNSIEKTIVLFDVHAFELYNDIKFDKERIDYEVFKKGLLGYIKLKKENKLIKNDLLTIIDYSVSSNRERLWIIDLNKKLIIYNTLVAHGKNSGEECAASFSNIPSSYQSSLGFYTTGEIYKGKHGASLYLHGVEKGVNDKAFERFIVMHGADYVSEKFIAENGRLGRSLGCPAIPVEINEELISLIANNSCVFIFYPEIDYLETSALLDENTIRFDDFS